MEVKNYNSITTVTAERGKYLIPKNLPEDLDVESMGKPIHIVFDNTGEILEFEEREVAE